jgi:hypothetical protein
MRTKDILKILCMLLLLILLVTPTKANKIYAETNTKNQATEIEGDITSTLVNGNFIVERNEKYALYSNNGSIIKDFVFDYIDVESPNLNMLFVKAGDRWGMIDNNGKEILPSKYDKLSWYGVIQFDNYGASSNLKGNISYMLDGKYGLCKPNGEIITKPEYEGIMSTLNFYIIKKNGKCGVLNEYGEIIVEPQFDEITQYTDDLLIVKSNNKFGLFSIKSGKVMTEFKYDSLEGVTEESNINYSDVLIYSKNNLYGLVDYKGKEIIKPIYDSISNAKKDNLFIVEQGGKYGIINEKGKILIKPIYKSINTYSEDKAIVINDNAKYGVIDKNGKIIIKPKYTFISDYINGTAIVAINGKYGVIDDEGKTIVKIQYEKIYEYSKETLATDFLKYKKNSKYGLMTREGKLIIKPIYDNVSYLGNNLFQIEQNGMTGILNGKGKVVLGLKKGEICYDVSQIENVINTYQNYKKYYSLDIFNDLLNTLTKTYDLSRSRILVKLKDKMEIYDDKGKLVYTMEGIYENVFFSNGFLYYENEGGVGVIKMN